MPEQAVAGEETTHVVADESPTRSLHALERQIDFARRVLYIIIAALMLLCFNGQWRIGLDSANYRGLADSLAHGRGYTFGTWAPRAIYPGLPLMLAGLQKIFGTSAWAPCIVINVMAVLTLLVTYKLVALRHPRWMAVAVTFGLGTNSWFLELANELLTDMPFLLGLVTALYGWERLRLTVKGGKVGGPILLLCVGLALAGMMRPTFWFLIVAWVLVCLWGLIRGPRKLSVIALSVMTVLLVLFIALDPRSRGFHIFNASPERQALQSFIEGPEGTRIRGSDTTSHGVVTETAEILWTRVHYILHDQLPTAFFGQRVAPLSVFVSLVLLASTLLLWRQPLWVLLVFVTLSGTALLSAEPRYYVMVLPLLILGWTTMLQRILQIAPGAFGVLLVWGLIFLVEGNNIARDVPIIIEQRSHPFIEHYHHGDYVQTIELAKKIHDLLPPQANVLGPSGAVLSYLSGRHVWTQREIFSPDIRPKLHEIDYPKRLADMHFDAAVFPGKWYRDKEPTIGRLMDRHVIVATHTLYQQTPLPPPPPKPGATTKPHGPENRLSLGTVEIRVPDQDWRKLGRVAQRVPHGAKKVHRKKKPATTQAAS